MKIMPSHIGRHIFIEVEDFESSRRELQRFKFEFLYTRNLALPKEVSETSESQ